MGRLTMELLELFRREEDVEELMAIAAPFRPGFYPVPKHVTRCADALKKVRDDEAAIRAVYQDVDARDANRCRCCGHLVSASGGLLWTRVHNHLHKRSTVAKLHKHTTHNIHLVCSRCDRLITNDKIRIIGTDCDKPLAFKRSPHATAAELKGIHLRDERTAA